MIRVLIAKGNPFIADALLQTLCDSSMETHVELREPNSGPEQPQYRDWDALLICPEHPPHTPAQFKQLAKGLPRGFPAWVVVDKAGVNDGVVAVAVGLAGCLAVSDRHLIPGLVTREVMCRGWARSQSDSPAAYSRSHKFMERVINTLPYDIVVRDGDSRILFCNDAFAAAYGFQAAELVGRLDREIWADFGRPAEQIQEWLAEDQLILRTSQDMEYIQRIDRPNGETAFIHNIKQVITLADGSRCILGMYTDVTERKRIEESLTKAQSEAAELNAIRKTAATYAHEINNPLTGIIGLVQLVLEDPGIDNDIADLLKEVIKASNRIKHVIKQMNELSSTQSRPYLDRGEILDLRDKPSGMVG